MAGGTKLSLKINVDGHLDKRGFMSYITSIMMSTYTPVDFRLPRPAGAGLAMTLSLTFSFKLWLSVFSANVHSDIYEL